MKAIKQQQQQCKYHGDYTATLWEHDVTYGITETWSDCPYCVGNYKKEKFLLTNGNFLEGDCK